MSQRNDYKEFDWNHEVIFDLNRIDRNDDAKTPLSDVILQYDKYHDVWWIMDKIKKESSLSYWYKTLRELIKHWNIIITDYANNEFIASPIITKNKL